MNVLQELATEARRINAANGWGLDFDPSSKNEIPSYLALIHSEITEVWWAKDAAEVQHELGDIAVRCLDLCELLITGELGRWEARSIGVDQLSANPERPIVWRGELMDLHARVTVALEVYRQKANFIEVLVQELLGIVQIVWQLMLDCEGPAPEQTIRNILEKNSKRAYRHGGRRT